MHREIWGKDAIKSNSWNGGRSDSLARLLGGLPLLLFGPLTHKDGGGGGGLARRQEVFTGSHAHQEAPAIRTARGWGKRGSGMGLEWHQLDFINLRPCVSSCRLQLHSTRLKSTRGIYNCCKYFLYYCNYIYGNANVNGSGIEVGVIMTMLRAVPSS